MHLVSTLANHEFLRLESVLDSLVVDVFAYLTYLNDKTVAEDEQRKYIENLNKSVRR